MIYITKAQQVNIARNTQKALANRGYTVELEDLKQQVTCIMNALAFMGMCEDDRDAYAPIHETAYYEDNGCAYLAAQDLIFADSDIRALQRYELANRRETMRETGTWTESHEREYLRRIA